MLSPVNSRAIVEDCLFADVAANALDATDARIEVRRCRFERVREAIHCTNSVSIILDSVFANIRGDSDAIDFDGGGPERSRIERCIFAIGQDDGIDLARVSVDILSNMFYGIADKAISVEENGASGPAVIAGNLVVASGTGMALKDGLRVEGDHNTVTACEIGMHFFAKDAGPDGGHGDFHSSIVWGNAVDVIVDARSTAAFSFSNLGGEVWPGEGNISTNPAFRDPAAGDFFLRAGSPCLGTGKDGSDMGALSVPAPPVTVFIRGDSDESGAVDISDPIHSLEYLFLNGPAPACRDRIDANDDGGLNISDPVFTLVHLFGGGGPPPPPFPDPGPDPTPDEVLCP
jgi:hypothetical protein